MADQVIIIAPHQPPPLPEWLAEHGMRLIEARPLGYIAAGWVAGWSAGWAAALTALAAEGWTLVKRPDEGDNHDAG